MRLDKKQLQYAMYAAFSTDYRNLKNLIVKGNKTNIRACPECWNPDQPQLMLGTFPVPVRNPRSDPELVASYT